MQLFSIPYKVEEKRKEGKGKDVEDERRLS